MNHPFGSLDPPRTLTERLARLNDNLQALGERLKAFVFGGVGARTAAGAEGHVQVFEVLDLRGHKYLAHRCDSHRCPSRSSGDTLSL